MTLHADAVAALAAWTPPAHDQVARRAEFLAYLRSHPDATSRSGRPDHLTASALVVDRAAGRVLLTLHRSVRRWLQTGGHCEPGDGTLAGAALREATEESGIADLSIDDVPLLLSRHGNTCGAGRGHHLDVQFLAVAPPGAIERASAESVDLRWFDADALPADTDDSVRRLADAAAVRAPAGDLADRGVSRLET